MKLENMPLSVTDWKKLSPIGVRGETGKAVTKESDHGDIRVRFVEYSANYRADHWCTRGHIAIVLEGELTFELEDGKSYDLSEDMSFQVGEKFTAHRVFSRTGARVIIFD